MVVAVGVDATHEGGEAFEPVDEAVFLQEFQRAVNRRGGGRAALDAQAIEQVVGPSGGAGVEDEAKYLAAQAGQAGATGGAPRLSAVEPGFDAGREGFGVHNGRIGRCARARHTGYDAPMTQAILDAISFDARGLVPVIAQQHDTREVLMMAWMDRAAVAETLATGRVCYFSRSRGRLWRKGETSGQVQTLRELRVDCDGDTLLVLVDQLGVACHTGRRDCFFRAVRDGALVEIAAPLVDPEALYGHG